MKRLFIILIILFFTVPVFAEDITFTPLTKDNEVETIGEIQMEITKSVNSEETLTLKEMKGRLDARIKTLNESIQMDINKLNKLEALRENLMQKAWAIKLKSQ